MGDLFFLTWPGRDEIKSATTATTTYLHENPAEMNSRCQVWIENSFPFTFPNFVCASLRSVKEFESRWHEMGKGNRMELEYFSEHFSIYL